MLLAASAIIQYRASVGGSPSVPITRFADQADALGHASRLCDGGDGGYDVADLMRMKKKI